jgi:hypothetical protein
MTRLRWYWTRTSMPLAALSKRILNRRYNDDDGDGFVLDQVRDDFIAGRYVERFTRIDETVSPFGKIDSYERIDYRSVRFRLSDTQPGLELWDAGRSYQKLVSRLLEATDFDLTIIAVGINPKQWAASFQKTADIGCRIDKITMRRHRVADDVLADIQVEGRGDVEAALARFVGQNTGAPTRLRLRFTDRPGSVVFTSEGALEVAASDQAPIIDAARRSISLAPAP